MKHVYIPKGETVEYDSLCTECLTVNGNLKIKGTLTVGQVCGSGVVEAGHIICDEICTGTVIAGQISVKRICAKRIFVLGECQATEAVAASDMIEAAVVVTGKLTATISRVGTVIADEVIHLKHKKRGLLSLLWRSWWRSRFLPGKKDGAKALKNKHAKAGTMKAGPGKSGDIKGVQPLRSQDGTEGGLALKVDDALQALILLLEAMRDSCKSSGNCGNAEDSDAA